MADNIRQWAEQHHAYYEVSAYSVVIEEGHGSRSVSTRRIQGGFDIDIYGAKIKNGRAGSSADYELAYAELNEIFRGRDHMTNSCSIEVIPFYSSVYLDARNNFQPQTVMRLKVSHSRGIDQPAGPAEADTLGKVEKQLQEFGIRSGRPAGS